MTNLVNQIASDIIPNLVRNPHNYTVETLIQNWEQRIEWMGFKVGGKAWEREMIKTARSAWIATTQKTTVFLAPSEETLSWGGFLGGEFVATEELRISADEAFERKFG